MAALSEWCTRAALTWRTACEDSVRGLTLLVNLGPTCGGFDLLQDRPREYRAGNSMRVLTLLNNLKPTCGGFNLLLKQWRWQRAVVWTVHFSLLYYVYLVSTLAYVAQYTVDAVDAARCCYCLCGNVMLFNAGYCLMSSRSLILELLRLLRHNEDLARRGGRSLPLLDETLRRVRGRLLLFYLFLLAESIVHYFRQAARRALLRPEELCLIKCYGMQPLRRAADRACCMLVIVVQGASSVSMMMSYRALLIVTMEHTTAMFRQLARDVARGVELSDELVQRHAALLLTVENLRGWLRAPLGTDFLNAAMCVCVSCALPAGSVLQFAPTLSFFVLDCGVYCVLGQRLEDAQAALERGLYESHWWAAPPPARRVLYTVLLVAQRSRPLLAGGVVPVRIATFASTMQAAYKFAASFKL